MNVEMKNDEDEDEDTSSLGETLPKSASLSKNDKVKTGTKQSTLSHFVT